MQLKNKTEREQFLENYKQWELWKEIPEIEVKLYRKELPNGTVIIATEYPMMKIPNYNSGNFTYKKDTDVVYHLLISDSDNYRIPFDVGNQKLYKPSGISKSSIIKYLTETRPEV